MTAPRTTVRTRQTLPDAVLADSGRQVLIGRGELSPPRLDVAALTVGEVGGEIFGVDLPPDPLGGDQVQGMPQTSRTGSARFQVRLPKRAV